MSADRELSPSGVVPSVATDATLDASVETRAEHMVGSDVEALLTPEQHARFLRVTRYMVEGFGDMGYGLFDAKEDLWRLATDLAAARSLPNRDALIVGADWMAGAINRRIQIGELDARSECGDAMLDYACIRHGDQRPIQGVEATYNAWLKRTREPRSPGPAAPAAPTPATPEKE